MRIHRYIYTRLPREHSPTGKSGFQSAFLPDDLLASKEVLEIESHIHFPEGLQIEGQTVVMYKTLKGQTYLVLLLLRPLLEVKDEHGRGGAFLCEGFLVAEQDWRPVTWVSALKRWIRPHQFGSLDQLLNSPEVDRAGGKIKDLLLSLPAGDAHAQEEADAPVPELLMAVYHVAHTQDRDLAVVLEGNPAEVSRRLEACAAFMPDVLRARVGWDDAFDGGKIFFSPLRIFGYSAAPPVTGRPVLFSALSGQARWPDDEMRRYGQPSDPFSTWLLKVCANPVPRALLNAMYALSQAMVSKSPASPEMETDPVFEEVNRAAIRKLFEAGLQPHLGERWTQQLGENISPHEQLAGWMRGNPISLVAQHLEATILARGIAPETVKEEPPARVVVQGSPTLQLLASMWTLEPPMEAVLAEVPEPRVGAVLRLILRRGAHTKLPFARVVAHFHSYLSPLVSESKIAENLRYYLEAKVPAAYADFKEVLAATLIALDEWGCLADLPTDWLGFLNQWLSTTGGDARMWKAIKKLGKEDLNAYPCVQAFALGDRIPPELGRPGEGRNGLLQALRTAHGRKRSALRDLGFSDAEIRALDGKGGLLGTVKHWFGR